MSRSGRKFGALGMTAAVAGLMLLASPERAAAQGARWYGYVQGGYSFLTGDVSDFNKAGFDTGLGFGAMLKERVFVGLFGDVGFHSGEETVISGVDFPKLTIWRYGVEGGVQAVDPAAGPWRVPIGLGLGLGTVSVEDGDSNTNFMLDGFIGVGRQVSPNVQVGIAGTFYVIFTDVSSTTGIPLSLYIAFTQ